MKDYYCYENTDEGVFEMTDTELENEIELILIDLQYEGINFNFHKQQTEAIDKLLALIHKRERRILDYIDHETDKVSIKPTECTKIIARCIRELKKEMGCEN